MKQIGLILLAAGSSLRYHGIKLLDLINGKKMYRHIIDETRGISFAEKVIVTQYDEIAHVADTEGFLVVMNHKPEAGISRSIYLGMEEIQKRNESLDAIMFSVCDQPYLKKNTILNMQKAYIEGEKGIVCACYEDKMGNPCIFSKVYFNELKNLRGDVGGKMVAKTHPSDCFYLQVDSEKELNDIDVRISNKNIF